MTVRDKQIVRELARRYMELASSEKQQRMNARMRATNDLKLVRPPVLIDEVPWYQMDIDGELVCQCEDERARGVETFLRIGLYRAKHLKADTLFEPFWRVHASYDRSDDGFTVEEKILRTDAENNIVSHAFTDVLADESALERFRIPTFTLRPDRDAENMAFYTDLLGDAMPVRLFGHSYVGFVPWDRVSRLRGMTNLMFDLYDRPEYLHRIMRAFCDELTAELDFIEKNMHVDNSQPNLHCTPAMISGLAEDGLKATWYRGAAQALADVSPAMFKEFEVDYIVPLAQRFAYTYYGCCEPLDNKIGVIRAIPNLRKVGVSPWADVEACGEQLRGDFVLSRKPNPANVAIRTDPEVVRREIEETVRVSQRYGCPFDYVLKDISTVSHRPENLIVWAQTVSDVLDGYYGEA